MDLDAMKALLAAVEAGMTTAAFMEWDGQRENFPSREYWWVAGALDGSTDAALALHGALLPGVRWDMWSDGHEYGVNVADNDTAYATTPARALLLATLRGVIAKMEAEAP